MKNDKILQQYFNNENIEIQEGELFVDDLLQDDGKSKISLPEDVKLYDIDFDFYKLSIEKIGIDENQKDINNLVIEILVEVYSKYTEDGEEGTPFYEKAKVSQEGLYKTILKNI